MAGIDQGQGKLYVPKKHVSVWDDLSITVLDQPFGFGTNPTRIAWNGGVVVAFQTNDEFFAFRQMKHSYKQGSTLRLHAHWTPHSRGVAESGNTVAWKVDLALANVGEAFPTMTTYDLTSTCSGTDGLHEIASAVDVPKANGLISMMMMIRVYRDTGDTWVGTSAGQSPALLDVDFHFEKDLPGSQEEFTKT